MPDKGRGRQGGTPGVHSMHASLPKVPVNLDACSAPMESPSSTPMFRSQRLKLPRPQRCTLPKHPCSSAPIASSPGDRSPPPQRSAPVPPPATRPSVSPPRAPHAAPQPPAPQPLKHSHRASNRPAGSQSTQVDRGSLLGVGRLRKPYPQLGLQRPHTKERILPDPTHTSTSMDDCEHTLALLPEGEHKVATGAGAHVARNTHPSAHGSAHTTPSESQHHTTPHKPVSQERQSELVLPAQPSEPSVCNPLDTLNLPFPVFEGTESRPLHLAAPISGQLHLAPPGVGRLPCTYTLGSSIVEKRKEESGVSTDAPHASASPTTPAAAASASPGAALAFGIGVNSHRQGLARATQRRLKGLVSTTWRLVEAAHHTTSTAHTAGESAEGRVKRPATEPLQKKCSSSGRSRSRTVPVQQEEEGGRPVTQLQHKRSRKRASDSCTSGQQRSSALESLMDSLELGLHQEEVVVPVHRYLPSIKPNRKKDCAELWSAIHASMPSMGHPAPPSSSSTFTVATALHPSAVLSPRGRATSTGACGPALGLTPTATLAPAVEPESEVFWTSDTVMDLDPSGTMHSSVHGGTMHSSTQFGSQSFHPYSSFSRMKGDSADRSLPFPTLFLSPPPPSEPSEGRLKEKQPPESIAVLSPGSLPPACLPVSPESTEAHLQRTDIYQTTVPSPLMRTMSGAGSACMGSGGSPLQPPVARASPLPVRVLHALLRTTLGIANESEGAPLSVGVTNAGHSSGAPLHASTGKRTRARMPVSTQKLSSARAAEHVQARGVQQRGRRGDSAALLSGCGLRKMLCVQQPDCSVVGE